MQTVESERSREINIWVHLILVVFIVALVTLLGFLVARTGWLALDAWEENREYIERQNDIRQQEWGEWNDVRVADHYAACLRNAIPLESHGLGGSRISKITIHHRIQLGKLTYEDMDDTLVSFGCNPIPEKAYQTRDAS